MDHFEEDSELVIDNSYDYSNILCTEDYILYLVQYCSQVYNQFIKLIEEDEQKNEKLKYEFQNYNFKKCFHEKLEILIREKNYNIITYKKYDNFVEAVKGGKLRNIDGVEIDLDLSYSRGQNNNLKRHENSFKIDFRPYEITFSRKSNYKESNMDQLENTINEILKKFPVANTIFCSK